MANAVRTLAILFILLPFLGFGQGRVGSIPAIPMVGGTGTNTTLNSPTITNPSGLVKNDVGLGNVPNVDATNPANIVQNATFRFSTDTEKSTWNAKQAALGYTPLNPANNLSNLATPATARTNLGLGSMATQLSSGVAITGGTIAGISSLGVSGNTSMTGNIQLGNFSSQSTGTPINIDMGGTYSNGGGLSPKLRIFNSGVISGFGASANQLDYIVPTGYQHAIYVNGVKIAFIDAAGHSPGTTNSYDLGTASLGWRNVYLSGNVSLGSANTTASAAPASLNMGTSISNSAGSNLKLQLYNSSGIVYGLGVSAGSLDYATPNVGASHNFYQGTTKVATIGSTATFATPMQHLFKTGSADPTTSDIPAGYAQLWKNTTSGAISWWVNDGGTMKKGAALTQ